MDQSMNAKEVTHNSMRNLQERLDAIIPILDAIKGQLDYAVNGNSNIVPPAMTKESSVAHNINTLHEATHQLEIKSREISKLVSSLLGN